jgi:hypothetical protein
LDTFTDHSIAGDTDVHAAGLLEYWMNALEARIAARVAALLGDGPPSMSDLPAPPVDRTSPFARFIEEQGCNVEATLLVALALAALVRPDLFDRAVVHAGAAGQNLELLGGLRGKQHRGMLPTGDTALFLLAGDDIAMRLAWQAYLLGDGALVRSGAVALDPAPVGDPPMAGRLSLDPDLSERFLTGRNRVPQMSSSFPARPLGTALDWRDLVLPARTLEQVEELLAWLAHGTAILDGWGLRAKLRPGCRALFFGPPGTGKTLTAALLGKMTGRDVLRIDLSMVVSKYIGETEKNLAQVFDKAERKDWILFFDEADALFGKRSAVKEAKDRYANQEIAFLLQRIEVFDGLCLLSSNLPGNVDEAFARRFEHVIHFPIPKAGERRRLWSNTLPAAAPLDPGVDLTSLSERHELTGASIANVVRHAALKAMQAGRKTLGELDIAEGIRRELAKEGRAR